MQRTLPTRKEPWSKQDSRTNGGHLRNTPPNCPRRALTSTLSMARCPKGQGNQYCFSRLPERLEGTGTFLTSETAYAFARVEGETLGESRLCWGEASAARLFHHPQLIGYLEHVWHHVSCDVSQVLVALTAYVALQRYPLVFNDDVNAGRCLPEVPRQRTRSNQQPIDAYTRLLIEGRWWQHLDVVDHHVHAFDVLHDILSRALRRRVDAGDITAQRDGVTLDAILDVVE